MVTRRMVNQTAKRPKTELQEIAMVGMYLLKHRVTDFRRKPESSVKNEQEMY